MTVWRGGLKSCCWFISRCDECFIHVNGKKSAREELQPNLNLFLLFIRGRCQRWSANAHSCLTNNLCSRVPHFLPSSLLRKHRETKAPCDVSADKSLRCWPVFVLSCRGGAEEAARGDQRGFSATGTGQRTEQETGTGAEDERGGQVQVRERARRRVRLEVKVNITVCFHRLCLQIGSESNAECSDCSAQRWYQNGL